MKVENKIRSRHCESSQKTWQSSLNKRTRQRSHLPFPTHNKAFSPAFTIVELLVVIIVIAILAAITIVSYRSISSNARKSALSSNLEQANKSFNVYKESSSTEVYPSTLSAAGSNLDTSMYTYYPSSDNKDYCLQGTTDGVTKSITGSSQTVQTTDCTENGLVGWWKLNGDATDSSGLDNNGTLHGTTAATGPNSDGALYFNGTSSDYITIPNDYGVINNSYYSSSWSMNIWTKWTSNTVTYPMIFGKTGWHSGIWIGADTNSYISVIASGSYTTTAGGYTTIDSSWHMLTLIYSNGSARAYNNGNLLGGGNVDSICDYGNSLLTIGSASSPFNGTLDDARIYNRALSANEILKLYQNGAQ